MKVSKDLSVSRNSDGCITIFSFHLGKTNVVTDQELQPLIEALQIEQASQQSAQADEGYECHCNAEHAHMTYIAHEEGCPARLRR